MNNLFIYPNAKFPIHDNDPKYYGVVPFCKEQINDIFNIVDDPNHADMFYMGQFPDSNKQIDLNNFPYINLKKDSHICDIEGDWFNTVLDEKCLSTLIFSMNGVKHEYKPYKDRICTRPTFSKLFVKLIKQTPKYTPEYNRVFGFMGFPDPFGVRVALQKICNNHNIDSKFIYRNQWYGSTENTQIHEDYINFMKQNTFCLCPRGTGVDTVRFFEACFFGRIPIIVSDNVVFGQYDKPFYFQLSTSLTMPEIVKAFQTIQNLPIETINQYSLNAIEYFNTEVKNYFHNPTKYFMKWYNERYPNKSH